MRYLVTQALGDVPDGYYALDDGESYLVQHTGEGRSVWLYGPVRSLARPITIDEQLAVADKLAAMTRDELKAAAETFSFETSRCYVCGVTLRDRNNHTGLSTSCRAKGLGFQ